MELYQDERVRYLGSDEQYYGKVGAISGIYMSKKYVELTFDNNGVKSVLNDVLLNHIETLRDKRMAGDFEIINAIHIGDKEIVLGENPYSEKSKYLCSYCESNDLFSSYDGAFVSDNYAEMVEMFGTRISQQAEKTMVEVEDIKIDKTPLSIKDCNPNDYSKCIDGTVIAIKTDVLRREYRTIDRQLYLVTGGNGSMANSRGSAVFCTNLYNGNKTRWERRDVLGTVKEDVIPNWAKENLSIFKNQQEKQKTKEER